ncbi:MAG: aspartyl/glutamyl-tRNA(Asn/Gln) amidotransferase subunit C [Chromatiales bacterium 21-64-14]|nr:MAG: aspartyl/glutamyl-tRNA(Asn/Gln) amidotransferase subunit C [Chromatiales bacterium 21-64-14]HQU15236.1 Asp-tRNA(Asn)/Glu-tRNA(Gln) amidotransferase subunit GatC [Gammaproteobacteria bacterium]
MALGPSEVKKIARLARIAVRAQDMDEYGRNLSRILEFVEQMNAVETRDVEPMAHPLEAIQRLRPDQVTETDQRAHFQTVAPKVEGGFYLVPKVIE